MFLKLYNAVDKYCSFGIQYRIPQVRAESRPVRSQTIVRQKKYNLSHKQARCGLLDNIQYKE